MKIKADFVTNSSSSSFVVMGTHLDTDKISEEAWGALAAKLEEKGDTLTPVEIVESFPEYIDSMMAHSGLEYSFGYDYYGESAMIGIPYTSMKDDETMSEFKGRVKIAIKNTFGFLTEVGHIEECWMDG